MTDETACPDGYRRKPLVFGGLVAGLLPICLLFGEGAGTRDPAARAQGVLSAVGSGEPVQTLGGGVVTEVFASDGDMVRAGQLIVRLTASGGRASERAMTREYMLLLAQRARLDAERGGLSVIVAPVEIAGAAPEDLEIANDAMTLQQRLLDAQRMGLATRQHILGQRIRQLEARGTGNEQRLAANRRQQSRIARDVERVRALAGTGLAPDTRLLALEKSLAALDRRQADILAENAATGDALVAARRELAVLASENDGETGRSMSDVETRINELAPRLAAAREHIAREAVRAPVAGRVRGLNLIAGTVAQPGQALTAIVPDELELILTAQLSRGELKAIGYGRNAEMRLTGERGPNPPALTGRVVRLSGPAAGKRPGKTLLTVDIALEPDVTARLRRNPGMLGRLSAGLPVEVFLPARSGTILDSLFGPLLALPRADGRNR